MLTESPLTGRLLSQSGPHAHTLTAIQPYRQVRHRVRTPFSCLEQGSGDDVQRICVFCGSSSGLTDQYLAAATGLGTLLADKGIGLVYGGAAVGLMGAVADAAMKAGGEVIGVIPKALVDREVAHTGLKDLRVVSSMHERKALMAELSDAFIAMPGGIGTFEEIFEVWTWTQLGSHAKPCALLNVGGFYDQLLGFLDHVVNESFMKSVHRDMLLVENDPMSLLARLETFVVPSETKWIGKSER